MNKSGDILIMRKISIIGAGNIGLAIANGLADSKEFSAKEIILTNKKFSILDGLDKRGFTLEKNNCEAVKNSDVVIITVEPQHLDNVLDEIGTVLVPDKHILISVVTGAKIEQISQKASKGVTVIRAMPNTAMAVRESMTCLASNNANQESMDIAQQIFDAVGTTLIIEEEMMSAATALAACGIAFFLRAIRAASQGGIEIGFHAKEALAMAAQTAKGAATLLLTNKNHPEHEIDRVTTPMGCTIAGLNRMEHEGFSSAMIKGITVSANKAAGLYKKD